MPQTLSAPSRKALAWAEVKAVDEAQGVIEGYLSVFNNVDSYGDVVEQGAFTKTIAEAKARRERSGQPYLWPLLWQHNPHEPIGGILDAREDARGLWIRAQLDLDTDLGRRAYSGLLKGYLRGLSIGFETLREEWKDGHRHLREIRLWEGSVVTFPANPETWVEDVKGASGATDLPLADRDRAWDADAAHKRIVEWASRDDGSIDPAKMRRVHFWYDSAAPENITSYKLLFADIIDGEPKAVPRGIFAVANVLQGGRGGVDIPEADKEAVRRKVAAYYRRMREEFNDDSIVPPWEKDGAVPSETRSEHLPRYEVGDQVQVLVEHMPGLAGKTATVRHVASGWFYGLDFGDGQVHLWYAEPELAPVPTPVEEPMPGMGMRAVKAGRRHSTGDINLIRSIIESAFALLDPPEQGDVLAALQAAYDQGTLPTAPDTGKAAPGPDGHHPAAPVHHPEGEAPEVKALEKLAEELLEARRKAEETAVLERLVADLRAARQALSH